MKTLIIFCDANVLYPAELRNLLMHLALVGLFRAKWSEEIHEEWIGSSLKNRPDLSRSQLEHTRHLMDTALPDALVSGYERLIPRLTLPDENDRHVLAAAIHCKANLIVTWNIIEFRRAFSISLTFAQNSQTSLFLNSSEQLLAWLSKPQKIIGQV